MARNDKAVRKTRAGRKQFLVYIDPTVTKDLKRHALELDESASILVEEAIRYFLERPKLWSDRFRAKKLP